MKKGFKVVFSVVVLLFVTISSLIYFNVLWKLASYYSVEAYVPLEVPVMDMIDYEEIWKTHRRPYIYSVKSKLGSEVFILGVNHTKDANNPQLDSIRYYWEKAKPDVVLVEGRVGNLFAWLQDPVKELGEGGFVTSLAHRDNVELFSWEPSQDAEIESLLQDFSKEQLAMFYSFRPYFSNMRYGKPQNPEAQLQEYLESRTDNQYLKGAFSSWKELDEKWRQDFPEADWRNHSSGNGYPDGYLKDIWNRSNLARDEHMLQVIFDLVDEQEKTVFVVMGASHAPRIEDTLIALIK